MRVIIVRTEEKRDLHPLLIGLLEPEGRHPMGTISEPEQREGFYWFPIRDTETGPDMVYTYKNGVLDKEVYKVPGADDIGKEIAAATNGIEDDGRVAAVG